jgi:GLPGLI family protein
MNRFTFAIFFLFAFSIWTTTITAQIHQGVIEYEYTIDVHRNIPPEREELKAMIPQFRTNNFQLFFNDAESLYKMKENPEADIAGGQGRGMRMMRMPRTETHIDRINKEVTVLQDFMGRNFLITEPLDIAPWKISHQQMEIAGYVCIMAWYNDTIQNQEITAWFTPQTQPFLGPDRYVTLPGTVLALDINNGERVWVARKIEDKEIRSSDLRKPNRGEQITRENFQKLVEEQSQRMNPGGTVIRF